MQKPENRWQLLLLADDGRILPFKRIRGIAIGLVVLLVVVGLICAGLAWQLAVEKDQHARTRDQLADARRQVDHFKHENERLAAQQVLADARSETAGPPVSPPAPPSAAPDERPTDGGPAGKEATAQPALSTPVATVPVPAPSPPAAPAAEATPAVEPAAPVTEKPVLPIGSDDKGGLSPEDTFPAAPSLLPRAPQTAAQTAVQEEVPVSPKKGPPPVALSDLSVTYNAVGQLFVARIRVRNTGMRKSPVAGTCVVVLGNERAQPNSWLALPEAPLVNGKPTGEGGREFKIAKYVEMEIARKGPRSHPGFQRAVVYVFDDTGALVLEKVFPIDLPAAGDAERRSS